MADHKIQKKLSPTRFIGAAVAITVVAYIVNTLGAFATMGYYTDPAYFAVWSKFMMPTAGPPPLEFTAASLIAGFLVALLFVFFYTRVRQVMKRWTCYGMLVFFVGTLPGFLSMALLINLPIGLIAAWTVLGLIINLIASWLVWKILK
jgi:hypothetical protein